MVQEAYDMNKYQLIVWNSQGCFNQEYYLNTNKTLTVLLYIRKDSTNGLKGLHLNMYHQNKRDTVKWHIFLNSYSIYIFGLNENLGWSCPTMTKRSLNFQIQLTFKSSFLLTVGDLNVRVSVNGHSWTLFVDWHHDKDAPFMEI